MKNKTTLRLLAIAVGLFLLLMGIVWGPFLFHYVRYAPQEGDMIFQSLPDSPLVGAIEGVTLSPYSHCGLLARHQSRWVVLEAYAGVERTPLFTFLQRGRDKRFSVYRLREAHAGHIPALVKAAEGFLGRPYDGKYRMDDRAIYCSELPYKAYFLATQGEQLGSLQKLGELNWKPYEVFIRLYEGGPPPLDEILITPQAVASAPQLRRVYSSLASLTNRKHP